jgi:peroxiredoxin
MKITRTLSLIGAAVTCIALTTAMTVAPGEDKVSDTSTPKKAEIGKLAPDFELTDIDGKKHKLSDYRGKIVVLEWFNGQCPFVVHQYREGVLKSLANTTHEKDDHVWLAINSGAPGQQGAGLELNRQIRNDFKIAFPILLDEPGKVGRMYDARRTPEMYVINKEGILVYRGAVDNAPNGRVRGGGEHVNYIENALKMVRAGETVSPDTTTAYGCTVKYVN